MPTPFRDHQPITIDEFMGLWKRGHPDDTPLDHFTDSLNLRHDAGGNVSTRYGIGVSQDVIAPLENIKRIYNYPTLDGNTLIILTYDYDAGAGKIYHLLDATTVYGPILTISGMTDFAFLPYAGRGYISPFSSSYPVLPKPVSGPGLEIASSANLVNPGLHKYAITFVTASGETTPSPVTEITTTEELTDPTEIPVVVEIAGVNVLDVGKTYKWLFTLSWEYDGPETSAGTASAGLVITSASKSIGLQTSALFAAGNYRVNVYRTVGNGATYYREQSNLLPGSFYLSGSGNYSAVGNLLDDAALILQPTAPGLNMTQQQQVELTDILVSPSADVTSRNLYRTEADDDQLKLLDSLADNTTTVYTDTTTDAALGADAPTKNTVTVGDITREVGLEGEFLYVYSGDGTEARKAAGVPLSGNLTIANGNPGYTDVGFHLFGFVSETDTGYLAAPGAITSFTTLADYSVSFGTVPASADLHVTKRHLVATKVIADYNGDPSGYIFYFVPNATINNNTDAFLNNISFFDADLLDDASHLSDNYEEIPAGAVLTLYHERLVLCATFDNISLGLVSAIGEPEAISQIDGLIVMPPDGNPITNAQPLRDILYVTKRSRTGYFVDNEDVPSSWPYDVADNALGSFVHGIGTELDSGSASVDYLLVCTYQGLLAFNGKYITPELTWKVEDYWKDLDRDNFHLLQIINAPIQKEIYIVLPNGSALVGNYSDGMEPMKMKWEPISFLMSVNTVAIYNIDEIIFGADRVD